MANKDRNKRSARQARQREREALAAEQAASARAAGKKKSSSASQATKKPTKVPAQKKNGLLARTKAYLGAVRGELRRVTWPSRNELTNYSVAVVGTLIAFGVVIWLVDTGFVGLLVAFTSLRG